jgi:hypothetical protein
MNESYGLAGTTNILKSEHFMIGGNFRKPNLSQIVQQLKFKLE